MTRITQVPGGQSSVVFGDDTPTSPSSRMPPVRQPAASPRAPPPLIVSADTAASNGTAAAMGEVPGAPAAESAAQQLEAVKLKAIAALLQLHTLTPEAVELINTFLQKLPATGCKTTAVVDADEALEKLRATLKQRGTHGILSLGKKFKSMDDDRDNKLSFDEFRKALVEMHLSEPDIHRLFRHFDADCNGYLVYDELLVGLRGNLSPARLDMVQRAFQVADKTGDGKVTLEDFTAHYDASRHPDVVLGVKTADQVLSEVMEVFEAQGGGTKGDGIITFDEFKRYYAAVSASIDLDDYFELVIRNAWHISGGGEGWCSNTTCKRVLVLHEDGSQSVQEVTNDLDVDSSQYVQKLKDQGMANIKSIALYSEPIVAPASKAAEASSPVPLTPSGSGRYAQRKPGGADHFRSSIRFG